jgi:hypothetical protein
MRKRVSFLVNLVFTIVLLSGLSAMLFGYEGIRTYIDVQSAEPVDPPSPVWYNHSYVSSGLYKSLVFGLGLLLVGSTIGYSVGRFVQRFHRETA